MDPTILQSLRGHGRRGGRPAPALLALDPSRAYLSQPDMQLRGSGGSGPGVRATTLSSASVPRPRGPPPRRRGRGRRCRGRGALRIGAGRPRRLTRRRRSLGLARGPPPNLYEQYVDEAGYQPGEVPDRGVGHETGHMGRKRNEPHPLPSPQPGRRRGHVGREGRGERRVRKRRPGRPACSRPRRERRRAPERGVGPAGRGGAG
jgi:hypothetical protein